MRRYPKGAVVLCLILAGCAHRLTPPSAAKPRRFACHRAAGPIAIDGVPDEPAWGHAEEILDFRVAGTGARPQTKASARFLWDNEYLYLAVTMEDLDIYGTRKEHDSQTWDDDVAELFIKPSDRTYPYYEFQVNALGTTFDALFGRRGAGGLDRWRPWESGMKAAVKIKGTLNNWEDKDQGWTVEVAIPLKAFTATTPLPQLGDRWRFAVCRYDYSVYINDGPEYTSSALLKEVNFHKYEYYDYLEFAE